MKGPSKCNPIMHKTLNKTQSTCKVRYSFKFKSLININIIVLDINVNICYQTNTIIHNKYYNIAFVNLNTDWLRKCFIYKQQIIQQKNTVSVVVKSPTFFLQLFTVFLYGLFGLRFCLS